MRCATLKTVLLTICCVANAQNPPLSNDELIKSAVAQLVAMQEEDGAWPYEGVYRVGGQIPIGYRVGGTAIVGQSLLYAAPTDDQAANRALQRGVEFILSQLDDPLLKPSTKDAYDVRVWGHCYVLEFFCRLRAADRCGTHRQQIEAWIPRLVEALITQELKEGGWNYASRKQHASFVTAPVVQSLLIARAQGEKVPDDVFDRARKTLNAARYDDGAFLYSGVRPGRHPATQSADAKARDAAKDIAAASQPSGADKPAAPTTAPVTTRPARRTELPGSIARSAVAESTLMMLGAQSQPQIRGAIDAFHTHWNELEKRRRKTGTHEGPYGIAPYYFYYGHRYAAQAIQMLPETERAAEAARLREVILRTRDEDGTWNDRVFPRSRNFGSAMCVMALLGDRVPLPPNLDGVRNR
ncbi:MAG: terpene cyclase/mutase family protein [Phycisphaerales bacterium]|nr:terpene cyclase/mutase family protein [Phycisphaerales bacterium]